MRTSFFPLCTLVSIVAGLAVQASAQVNSYVPVTGGDWNVAGNWSLGHVPVQNESPYIIVSGNAHKTVTYDWGGISNYATIRLDGSTAGFYTLLFQPEFALTTVDEQIGLAGDAWHWLEGPAFLWVNNNLYVGYSGTGTGTGYFYMATVANLSAGLYVGDLCYVGYSAPGHFDLSGGIADVGRLYVGQNDPGTLWMHSAASGLLTIQGQFVVGNGDEGLVDQTGGTIDQVGANGLIMGLNTGGIGTYLMKGGTLNVDHISLAFNGDAYFTQTGGTVNIDNNVTIGSSGTHAMRAWYKLDDTDGTAALNIGGNLSVGAYTLGKYEQEGGTAIVTGDIEIWDGDADPGTSSYLYMGLNAGSLRSGTLTNHTGYFDQDGGIFQAGTFTNDSTQGVNFDNNADCRVSNFVHNAGPLFMWRNAIVRGPYAGGGMWFACSLTNNATIQMGNASFDGGSFRGFLTNNGTFNYGQGDFSTSTLTNYGAVFFSNNFTCRRIVNHATGFSIPVSLIVTADGAGYANAVENNGSFTMRSGSHLDVGTSRMVNNGPMYAGGPGATPATIHGDLENNDYLLPSDSALGAGSQLVVNSDFTATSTAELRIRLRGEATGEYDRLTVLGTATLGGDLDVRLTNGFLPSLGDRFYPVSWGTRVGTFDTHKLPMLPPGLAWNVSYGTTQLRLSVVTAPECPGDLDGDNDIDITDLAVLLSHYGTAGGASAADGDLDGDRDVDLADLAALLARFGIRC